MNAVLPFEEASKICFQWMQTLTTESDENGCMLGVLVCTDGTVLMFLPALKCQSLKRILQTGMLF